MLKKQLSAITVHKMYSSKHTGKQWGCCTRDQKISDVTAPSSKKSSFFIEIREVFPVVFLDGRTFPGPVTRQGLSLLTGLFLCAFLQRKQVIPGSVSLNLMVQLIDVMCKCQKYRFCFHILAPTAQKSTESTVLL